MSPASSAYLLLPIWLLRNKPLLKKKNIIELRGLSWVVLGVSFVVVDIWCLALESTKGSPGLHVQDGGFTHSPDTLVGMATVAKDCLSIILF